MSMLSYAGQRFLYMILMMVVLSMVVFFIIQLPPGDYATSYIRELEMKGGGEVGEAQIVAIRKQYGLDLPVYRQYLRWVSGFMRGYLGRSFYWNRPINELLAERLPYTLIISLSTVAFTYLIAIPIGIYSATHQYSIFDYVVTVIGFTGIAIPGFLFALIMMYVFHEYFGLSVGSLFSPKYVSAPWSWARVLDMLKHIWAPVLIVGLAGTCSIIRVMRASLLDELSHPYVVTARAKGLKERNLIMKYPVRIAINPILSTVGWILPGVFSGSTIVAVVLALPTVGPLLLDALTAQDFYVSGSIVMILTLLTLIGTFVSDILLGLADPRVRFD
jgi:peptide/nickel transport system permease protein